MDSCDISPKPQDIFCKIARKEVGYYLVEERENFMAVLSPSQKVEGETTVFPKEHWGGYLFEYQPAQYLSLMAFARDVARDLDVKLGSDRTAIMCQGYSIPTHVHLKLFPHTNKYVDAVAIDQPTPLEKRERATPERLEEIVAKLGQKHHLKASS